MKALLLSGLWPTADHNGLVDLSNRMQSELGIATAVGNYDSPMLPIADIYIGHSLGAEICLKLITMRPDLAVHYFASIDGVWGDWFPFFFWNAGKHFDVPPNVLLSDAFRRKGAFVPPSSRILNPTSGWKNYDMDSNHKDAPRNHDVISTIMKSLSKIKSSS